MPNSSRLKIPTQGSPSRRTNSDVRSSRYGPLSAVRLICNTSNRGPATHAAPLFPPTRRFHAGAPGICGTEQRDGLPLRQLRHRVQPLPLCVLSPLPRRTQELIVTIVVPAWLWCGRGKQFGVTLRSPIWTFGAARPTPCSLSPSIVVAASTTRYCNPFQTSQLLSNQNQNSPPSLPTGFYIRTTQRWGDAPVHSIAAALFAGVDKIHFFREIGYEHSPYTHCPAEEATWKRDRCTCDPAHSFGTQFIRYLYMR